MNYYHGKIGVPKPHRICFRISESLNKKCADYSMQNSMNKTDTYTELFEKGLEHESVCLSREIYKDALAKFLMQIGKNEKQRDRLMETFNEILKESANV